MTIGLTNGAANVGLGEVAGSQQAYLYSAIPYYGAEASAQTASPVGTFGPTGWNSMGLATDPDYSGIVADISFVDGWSPTFVIKY